MAGLSMIIDWCTRSILPPCSIHGMRGSRKTSCNEKEYKKEKYEMST